MFENLTPEQSDALILEALSPSSGTNEQEQDDDAPESTEVEEETEEVQETESDEDGTDSEPEQPQEKKKSSAEKLLAQRNEARREAQELRKQLAEINKAKLNEKYDPESISDFSTISDESAMSIYKQ